MERFLIPNNINLFSYRENIFNNNNWKELCLSIFPVYKHKWKNCNIVKDNTEYYLNCENIPSNRNTIKINKDDILFNNNIDIVRNNKNDKMLEFEIGDIYYRISYQAYSFLLLKKKKIKFFTKLESYGIIEAANELGIFVNKSKKDNIKNIFGSTFQSITLKGLEYDNQIQILKYWIEKKDVLITGGTGIGKTSQIPKLFWYFNYLFDGYETFNILQYLDNYLEFEFDFNIENNNTVLSLPRKSLVISTGKWLYESIGYNTIKGSPLVFKYRDLQEEFKNDANVSYKFIILVNALSPLYLNKINTIIFDEIHEHDDYADISIAIFRKYKIKYNIRNMILMTATYKEDSNNIKLFFPNIEYFHLPNERLFFVKEIYKNETLIDLLDVKLPDIGNVGIIFVPTIKETEKYYKLISEKFINKNDIKIYNIHGQKKDKDEILNIVQNKNKLYISLLISTPYLESSITIKNAEIVYDSGLFLQIIFNTTSREYISESMYEQRKGRVGRKFPGYYIYNYNKNNFNKNNRVIDKNFLHKYIIYFTKYDLTYKDLFIKPEEYRWVNTYNYLNYIFENKFKKNINSIYFEYTNNDVKIIEYLKILIDYMDRFKLRSIVINIINDENYIETLNANIKYKLAIVLNIRYKVKKYTKSKIKLDPLCYYDNNDRIEYVKNFNLNTTVYQISQNRFVTI